MLIFQDSDLVSAMTDPYKRVVDLSARNNKVRPMNDTQDTNWIESLYQVPDGVFKGFTKLERYLYNLQSLVLTKESQPLECLTCGVYQGQSVYKVYQEGKVEHPNVPFLKISEVSSCCLRSTCLPSMKPARYNLQYMSTDSKTLT